MDDDRLGERLARWHEETMARAPSFAGVLHGPPRRRARRALLLPLAAGVAVAVLLVVRGGRQGQGHVASPDVVVTVDRGADPFAPSMMDDLLWPAEPAEKR